MPCVPSQTFHGVHHPKEGRSAPRRLTYCTFGGLGDELVEVLEAAAAGRGDRLTAEEYDETTWSARTWLTFVEQRISVATQRAVTKEIAVALGLPQATDPRGDDA